ncbi:glycoside hydrolase [Streptomyces lycii]|uniref:Glycoside hydrolase n=1 Tax=Streptomyces lycii TaxID=2654337 RepID=A0ABQ7FBJ0_9ACTN|nr:glycoside hydrolase [Streptomyces lycii]
MAASRLGRQAVSKAVPADGRKHQPRRRWPVGRQRAIVTATAVVCAVGATLMAPGAAHALSADDPERPAATAAPGEGFGESGELEKVRQEIEGLYRKAGSATDAYNSAKEKTERQSKKIAEIDRKAAAAKRRMERLQKQAGAMVRAQYRAGGMPDEAHLLLGSDSGTYLHDAAVARKGQQAQKGLIKSLAGTRKQLDTYAETAEGQWRKLKAEQKKKAAAAKRIETKIEAAEKLESELAAEELERLRELEDEAARAAQAKWLDSGVWDEIDARASKKGKKAVAYAMAQLGKDYEWGAEGPWTYDCSGLTSQAWAAGGAPIPRTSQEQWKQLDRIGIKDMRPGDLIIYHGDASHVGMYIGDGSMVHAPRPGRQVTVAGAGSMRILGVVRPDR